MISSIEIPEPIHPTPRPTFNYVPFWWCLDWFLKHCTYTIQSPTGPAHAHAQQSTHMFMCVYVYNTNHAQSEDKHMEYGI